MKSMCLILLLFLVGSFAIAQTVSHTNELPLDRSSTRIDRSARESIGHAATWGLSNEEWERHLELLRGIRGRLSSKSISPVEVLGIHARNDSERKHYARVWARMMLDDADRILKFQKAYDQAIADISAGMPLIDPDLVPLAGPEDKLELQSSDRIMYFTSLDCVACEVVYDRSSRLLTRVDGIDVYFVDTDSTDYGRIRSWAQNRGIEPLDVRSKKVTLNFDNGTLKTLVPRMRKVPFLMLRRGEESLDFPNYLLH